MNTKNMTLLLMAAGLSLPFAAQAQAQDADDDFDQAEDQAPPETEFPDESLPPAVSGTDARPPVATPAKPTGSGLIQQAGIGGQTAYGRAGVLELGGSAGFMSAEDLTQLNFTPSIGYFIADNLEVSALLGAAYIKAGDNDSTMVSLLVEPSYHLPFSNSVFGFLGVGVGVSYIEGPGTGFAVAPRLGANVMVGRSGILSPYVSYGYTTHDSVEVANGMSLLTVSSAIAANIGYTVMW